MLRIACRACILHVAISVVSSAWSLGATRHVPADDPTIQACIDAAVDGDECLVAPGTYNETINFLGKAITLRSSHGADATTIDATGLGGSVVTCASDEGPDTVLDGFTITGGTGTLVGTDRVGGGMYNVGSSPKVVGCNFVLHLDIRRGGATYTRGGAPRFSVCVFDQNAASSGGGMYNEDSNPEIVRCLFDRNHASIGGGISNVGGSPFVERCTFVRNGVSNYGAAVYCIRSTPTFLKCDFVANSSLHNARGIYADLSRLTVVECTFRANVAAGIGDAIWVINDQNSIATDCVFVGHKYGALVLHGGSPMVSNCIFAARALGSIHFADSRGTVTGCILWPSGPLFVETTGGYVPTIRFSNLQGGLPSGAIDGGGNIDLDPLFVRNPSDGGDGWGDNGSTFNVDEGANDDYGDLRLQPGSPCINAGDPGFVPQPSETDLDGHARVLCGRVDMGAYEFGIGDYDCDQTVDLTDFAAWEGCMTGPNEWSVASDQWPDEGLDRTADTAVAREPSPLPLSQGERGGVGCEAFDFNADGQIDLGDFAAFQRLPIAP